MSATKPVTSQHEAEVEPPFVAARKLLRAAEAMLWVAPPKESKRGTLWRAEEWFYRLVVVPIGMIMHGVHGLTLAMADVLIAMLLAAGVVESAVWFGLADWDRQKTYMLLGLIGSAFALFQGPSRYMQHSYSTEYLDGVLGAVDEIRGKTSEYLEGILKSFARHESAAEGRLQTVKWLAGAVWAVTAFMAQREVMYLLDHPSAHVKIFSTSVNYMFGASLLATIVSYSYTIATKSVYMLASEAVAQIKAENAEKDKRKRPRRRVGKI